MLIAEPGGSVIRLLSLPFHRCQPVTFQALNGSRGTCGEQPCVAGIALSNSVFAVPRQRATKPPDAMDCTSQNGRGGEYMPGGDRRVYKLTDLLTKDELNEAMKLFIECRNAKEKFRQRCAKEVVEPIISRVNALAGYDASTASLVYRLEMYLRAVSNTSLNFSQRSLRLAHATAVR
jgi:hypothetical protein